MEADKLKHAVLHSLKWVAAGKILTQLVRWVITFWVIRLLTPEDYGLVAMADVLLSLLLLITGSLFSPGIVQAKHIDNLTLKRIFGGILLVHTSIFLIQFFSAGLMADFYGAEEVESILKVSAISFLVLAFGIIPQALLAREMQFKKVSIISAVSNIGAALTTLVMAFNDYGFWSLVIGEIVMITVKTLLLMIFSPALMWPRFDLSAIADYIKFGGMLTVHVILFYIFIHMDVFIAGRVLNAAEVGLFALGLQFAAMPQKKLLPLLRSVAFPAFSKVQDETSKVAHYVMKSQRLSLLVAIPIFWGLASVIDLIVPILLGDKWVEAVYPCMIILLVMPLRFSDELFYPALKSQRKVKHMIINVMICIVALSAGLFGFIHMGAEGIALAWAVSFPIAYSILMVRNCSALSLKVSDMVKVIYPLVSVGLLMLAAVFSYKFFFPEVTLVHLVAQVIIGAVSYIVALYIFKKSLFTELLGLVRRAG